MTAHSLAAARALVRCMLRHAGVRLSDVRAERVLMGTLAKRCIGRRDAVVLLGRADASPMGAEERAVWDQRAGGA